MTARPCVRCGTVIPKGSHCDDCRPPDNKGSSTARGYDHRWTLLSRRARQHQPFCGQCGTQEDLTTDHSEEAWQRKARGLAIRLRDVTVLCRSCNAKKGAARPTPVGVNPPDSRPVGEARGALHTPGGIG